MSTHRRASAQEAPDHKLSGARSASKRANRLESPRWRSVLGFACVGGRRTSSPLHGRATLCEPSFSDPVGCSGRTARTSGCRHMRASPADQMAAGRIAARHLPERLEEGGQVAPLVAEPAARSSTSSARSAVGSEISSCCGASSASSMPLCMKLRSNHLRHLARRVTPPQLLVDQRLGALAALRLPWTG